MEKKLVIDKKTWAVVTEHGSGVFYANCHHEDTERLVYSWNLLRSVSIERLRELNQHDCCATDIDIRLPKRKKK